MKNASSAGVLYASNMDKCTPSSPVRERERERERERDIYIYKERKRKEKRE